VTARRSAASVERARAAGGDHARDFDTRLRHLSDRHERWRAFADFCEVGALSFANVFRQDPKIEERYARILATYDEEERSALPELLGVVTEALEDEPAEDFLGAAFMRNELSSHWAGQFFTPASVSLAIAATLVGDGEDLRARVAERGYVSLAEPACGAGGMVLAFAHAMREAGIEPQRHLYVEATDLSPTCAHMTLIQLSLSGIPARVVLGNSLSLEVRETFETPAFHIGLWGARLRGAERLPRLDVAVDDPPTAAPVVEPTVAAARRGKPAQLSLDLGDAA